MSEKVNNHSDIIQMLLEILEHDRRQVMLFVAICFAIPSFTLSNFEVSNLPLLIRIPLAFSLTFFIISGLFYFLYTQNIHYKRFQGLQAIIDNDPNLLREKLFGIKEGVWATAGRLFVIGKIFFKLAFLIYVLFFILLIFKNELF